MSSDGPTPLVLPHVDPEGGSHHDPEVGAVCVVLVVGGLSVGMVCNVNVVRGQELLHESGQKADRVCEGLIRDQVEVRSSRFKRPLGEPVVGVVALAEDMVGDGLTPGSEDVPGCGCSKDLGTLGVQREDLNAAESA
jgi:hypothetical protein